MYITDVKAITSLQICMSGVPGLEITARHQTMSGHILKCLAEINFTSAIEQTYDWTNYFKHEIIFVKYFPS